MVLYLLLTAHEKGERRVSIADGPDCTRILTTLKVGEWSPPLLILAVGRRGETSFAFRIKLLRCEGNTVDFGFFNTAIHELCGHSEPAAVWDKHIGVIGPIEEQTDPSVFFSGDIDLETQLEIFQLNADWLQRAAVTLLHNEPWELFMLQMHFVDWAHHIFHGAIDSRHPEFCESKATSYETMLLHCYLMADKVVSAVAQAVGDSVDIMVMGDHGQDLHHTTFRGNTLLEHMGFLEWNPGTGEVDWPNTKAYCAGNYIFINQQGREPLGVVPADRVDQTIDRIIDRFLSASDPITGSRPVLIAGPKCEFQEFGANGSGVGDIVFCLRSGYQARNSSGSLFEQTHLFKEFTSGHDHFWPLDSRIHTLCFAKGPSFRRGYLHTKLQRVTDVHPTVCKILNIAFPPEVDGHSVNEILALE